VDSHSTHGGQHKTLASLVESADGVVQAGRGAGPGREAVQVVQVVGERRPAATRQSDGLASGTGPGMRRTAGRRAMDSQVVQDKRPDKTAALEYLLKVRGALNLEKYSIFLDRLTRFKAKQIGAEELVSTVLPMLQGREDLLTGFSQFLPQNCRQSLISRYLRHDSASPAPASPAPRDAAAPASPALVPAVPTHQEAASTPPLGAHVSQPTKEARAKRSSATFDRSEWVGEMPAVETKRRREFVGARELRPAPSFRADSGTQRQSNQRHVYQAKMKDELRPKGIDRSLARIEARLQASVEEVLKDPQNWIPSIDYDDIVEGRVNEEVIARIRRAGVLRIRKVVPKEIAMDMNERIMEDFREHFKVDPARPETYSQRIYSEVEPKAFTFGGVQELYYTKAQFEARQHDNMHRVKVWLNGLWKDDGDAGEESGGQTNAYVSEADITYVDRWRHRLPGYDKQTGMKEHLDNGAMCRWADDAYREVYRHIMEGNFDSYDPWVVGARARTSGSFFRAFQGWLALTPQGSGDGTLEVVPLVAEAMAYLLLRPFARDVPGHQFCGVSETGGDETLEITQKWHAALLRAKVSVGSVEPGDTVWWHPDIIHGVEEEHAGKCASNVIYVAAAPLCPQNARYLVKQRDAFLRGESPPDFPQAPLVEKGSSRKADVDALSRLGRMQMGLEPWSDSILKTEMDEKQYARKLRVIQECNRIMFPDGDAVFKGVEGRSRAPAKKEESPPKISKGSKSDEALARDLSERATPPKKHR